MRKIADHRSTLFGKLVYYSGKILAIIWIIKFMQVKITTKFELLNIGNQEPSIPILSTRTTE